MIAEKTDGCSIVEGAFKCAKNHQDENLTASLAAGLTRLNESDVEKCVDKLERQRKIVQSGKKFMGDNPYAPTAT